MSEITKYQKGLCVSGVSVECLGTPSMDSSTMTFVQG